MAAPGFTVVYAFPYRGASEEWSQQYHLDADFSDVADWHTTFDAFVTAVRPALYPVVTVVRGYGYHNTDNDSFNTYELPTPLAGTLSPSLGVYSPGDDAGWVRWNTERTNTRGRLVYLRKYFHPIQNDGTAGNVDLTLAGWRTAVKTFADNATGTGWNGKHLAGPDGNVPGGGTLASTYITTRTLHRRGRRP